MRPRPMDFRRGPCFPSGSERFLSFGPYRLHGRSYRCLPPFSPLTMGPPLLFCRRSSSRTFELLRSRAPPDHSLFPNGVPSLFLPPFLVYVVVWIHAMFFSPRSMMFLPLSCVADNHPPMCVHPPPHSSPLLPPTHPPHPPLPFPSHGLFFFPVPDTQHSVFSS